MLICATSKGRVMSHVESSFTHALILLPPNALMLLVTHMIKGNGWVKGGHVTSYVP